jgi:hypothetical protein
VPSSTIAPTLIVTAKLSEHSDVEVWATARDLDLELPTPEVHQYFTE